MEDTQIVLVCDANGVEKELSSLLLTVMNREYLNPQMVELSHVIHVSTLNYSVNIQKMLAT